MRSRGKIIDATLGLIAESGFEAVTIAAAARAAGVSRQTVYTIFRTREDLVSQAMTGVLVDLVGGIEARVGKAETSSEFIVELIVAGRDVLHRDPVLHSLLHLREGNPLFDPGMMGRARPVVRRFLDVLVERDPGLTAAELDDVSDIVVRAALSVVLFDDPSIHEDDDLRRYLARWLVPVLPFDSQPRIPKS